MAGPGLIAIGSSEPAQKALKVKYFDSLTLKKNLGQPQNEQTIWEYPSTATVQGFTCHEEIVSLNDIAMSI